MRLTAKQNKVVIEVQEYLSNCEIEIDENQIDFYYNNSNVARITTFRYEIFSFKTWRGNDIGATTSEEFKSFPTLNELRPVLDKIRQQP